MPPTERAARALWLLAGRRDHRRRPWRGVRAAAREPCKESARSEYNMNPLRAPNPLLPSRDRLLLQELLKSGPLATVPVPPVAAARTNAPAPGWHGWWRHERVQGILPAVQCGGSPARPDGGIQFVSSVLWELAVVRSADLVAISIEKPCISGRAGGTAAASVLTCAEQSSARVMDLYYNTVSRTWTKRRETTSQSVSVVVVIYTFQSAGTEIWPDGGALA